ncbi:MAG: S4 domain-containing protein [Pseudomonadota bacterium]
MSGQSSKTSRPSGDTQIRLDKWIWAARFCKTRTIARDWIQAGKVKYNGQRTKPSKIIEKGALVLIPAGFDTKTVVIEVLSEQRQKAAIAQTLYSETEESIALRDKNKQARQLSAFHNPKPLQKPDKKQRRQLIQVKQQETK